MEKIHIMVTDGDRNVLFDSKNYKEDLCIQVYSCDGNLLFFSGELVMNGKQADDSNLQFREAPACKRRGRPRKVALKKNDCGTTNDRRTSGRQRKSKDQNPVVLLAPLNNVEVKPLDIVNKTEDICDDGDDHGGEENLGAECNNSCTDANSDLSKDIPDIKMTKLKKRRKASKKLQSLTAKSKDSDQPEEPVSCDICGVKYKSSIMLARHKAVHDEEKTDAGNPLQCTICHKVYKNWRSLTIHKRKHGAAKDNVCEKCGKGFRTKQELIRHEFVHSDHKSSPCHICGKLFKNKAYAQMHSKLHSAENRKHVCKLCGKHFLRGPDIQKHMRIHTGEKPFICSQCGRSFSESSHLIRHERLHSGEKPYKCDTCGLCFTHKEVLIRHSYSHMEHLPFSCEVCNKGFKTKRELDSHWLVHDKPNDPALKQTCEVCGKVFSHILYLRYHMRTHNNLGSHECPVCAKVFKKPCYLKQHIVNLHPFTSESSVINASSGLISDSMSDSQTHQASDETNAALETEIETCNTTNLQVIPDQTYTDVSKNIKQLLVQHLQNQKDKCMEEESFLSGDCLPT